MPAPKGNRFWEARSSHGRKPIFESQEQLWNAAVEYFAWVEDNPYWETKAVSDSGKPTTIELPKMRPMTEAGLVQFLDIGWSTWDDYKHKEDFSEVTKQIEKVIYNQKLSGAASGFFNANIIARDLGLSDKAEQTIQGGDKPIKTESSITFIGVGSDHSSDQDS